MTPGVYRRGGKGMSIRYTITDSPLGRLLLAGTDRGVSALYLGDGDAELEAALKREYPAAVVRREDGGLGPWLKAVLDHLGGGLPHLDLPLDVQATAFQWRVWQELRKIPSGSPRTYNQAAAVRAVARACATNPVSVVIPCHRVVRGDGDLAGYRWGVARKKKLLAQEQGRAAAP